MLRAALAGIPRQGDPAALDVHRPVESRSNGSDRLGDVIGQ